MSVNPLQFIKNLFAGLLTARKGVPSSERVFCLSMQRNGTSSLGDFCEFELGMARRGYPHSRDNDWSRMWFEGRGDKIFASPDFRTGQVFEDDPWWCGNFYEEVFERFPDAAYVLVTRDPDAWFRSMRSHSKGASLGHTDIHARIYDREEEWADIRAKNPSLKPQKMQGLSLDDMEDHYKAVYNRYNKAVLDFFAARPEARFLNLDLADDGKWGKLAVFLGFGEKNYPDTHTNASHGRS